MKLSLERLLAKLSGAGIVLIELRQLPEAGVDVYTFQAPGPSFPFGSGRRQFWASLSVIRGQLWVDKQEAEALLRHLWHAEIELNLAELRYKGEDSRAAEG